MKKKNGFTLIELLAVIVILAIIAVIVTPIIVNIIEESRKASFERSVEGIIHATYLDFGTQEVLSDESYIITNGVINKVLKTPIKNIDGFSGTIKYDEKGNSTYAIYNDKWCMIKSSTGNITTKEYENNNCEIPKLPYMDGTIVYFDVSRGVECSDVEYHEDNSKTGYNGIYEGENSTATTENQNRCLKFYAFNDDEGDTVVNLLLDHNTTAEACWTSSSTSANSSGPIDAIGKLQTDTSSWMGTKVPDDYSLIQNENGYNCIINYDNNDEAMDYKARLLTAGEVAEIIEQKNWSEKNAMADLSFSNTYGWLYDRTDTSCVRYGCFNNAVGSTFGYWTATSHSQDLYGAWMIWGYVTLGYNYVDCEFRGNGVRPVIEVLKSNLE